MVPDPSLLESLIKDLFVWLNPSQFTDLQIHRYWHNIGQILKDAHVRIDGFICSQDNDFHDDLTFDSR